MEGVHSFEKRSQTESDRLRGNRLVIANRHEPDVSWNTSSQVAEPRGFWSCIRCLCPLCPGCSECRQSSLSDAKRRRQMATAAAAAAAVSGAGPTAPLGKPGAPSGPADSLSASAGPATLDSALDECITLDSGPFPTNEWRTSKYTVWSFLPKNLFEQFRRLANFYFLLTGIIQLTIPYSPVGPFTSLAPLFFVVTTTAIKQAYEDYLRHQLDNEVNNRPCRVLRAKQLHPVRSMDIRVGDIVQVRNNEEIPCDMILLAASGTGDRCYVTTANLDGETSLKSRTCFAVRSQIGPIERIDDSLLLVECERPNATLYEFNGVLRSPRDSKAYERLVSAALELSNDQAAGLARSKKTGPLARLQLQQNELAAQWRASIIKQIHRQLKRTRLQLAAARRPASQTSADESGATSGSSSPEAARAAATVTTDNSSQKSSDNVEIALDISNLLLRASRLRNTSFVYGLAVHTGMDTKLAHNSHVKPNKFSTTETRVNVYLFVSFLALATLTVVSSLYVNWLRSGSARRGNSQTRIGFAIDRRQFDNLSDLLEVQDSRSLSAYTRRAYGFLENFLAHFLLYNYIIPISLYVTLEFVKFFGTLAVVNDKKMRALVWKTSSNGDSTTGPVAAPAATGQHSPQAANSGNGVSNGTSGNTNTNTNASNNSNNHSARAPARRTQVAEKPQCNSSDLNEDLGQVEVLVTDKTGTLTENKMRFRACSIQGLLYRSISGQLYHQPAGWCAMAVPNLVGKLNRIQTNRYAAIGPASAAGYANPQTLGQFERASQSASIVGSSTRVAKNPRERPFDHRFVPPLSELSQVSGQLERHEQVVDFFVCLCLCSTISLNETRPIAECLPDRQAPDFQSASPDEESLIAAARQFGITMCKSNEHECYIAIRRSPATGGGPTQPAATGNGGALGPATAKPAAAPPVGKSAPPKSRSRKQGRPQFVALVETALSTDRFIVRRFERLLVFEFDSTRKRMSVVYRDCDTDCKLMVTKGSESVLDCVRLARLGADSELVVNLTLAHFEAFAKSGLRTMLVAKRLIGDAEYERILVEMRLARMATACRDQLMDSLYKRVESGLSLVGTTAVEDTLQEGVPETIAQLKEAGIKVWLLTGDKVETAVSVAYLCKLLDRNMTPLYLVRQQDAKMCRETLALMARELERANAEFEQQALGQLGPASARSEPAGGAKSPHRSTRSGGAGAAAALAKAKSKSSPDFRPVARSVAVQSLGAIKSKSPLKMQQQHQEPTATGSLDEWLDEEELAPRSALIVDGRSLHYAMKYARQELEMVCERCTCVLGCRLSPLQKAEVVSMIKSAAGQPITAAIGDGANDVSMIQEAHVGIGISGKEGRQAVNSSDFAIKRFHMLSRLFLVHGHFFYHRTANMIHYFFYKNILFISPQFIFSFYSNNKTKPAVSIYHPIMLITFNLLFTSLPILVYGLMERHLKEAELEQQPKLYRINRQNYLMRMTVYVSWMVLGISQACVAYYWLTYIWDTPWPIDNENKPFLSGRAGQLLADSSAGYAFSGSPTADKLINYSTILYCSIVFAATIKLYFLAKYKNCYFHLAALTSILSLPLCFYIFSLVNWVPLLDTNSLYHKFTPLLSLPIFWVALSSTVAVTTVPDMIFTHFHR